MKIRNFSIYSEQLALNEAIETDNFNSISYSKKAEKLLIENEGLKLVNFRVEEF